MTLLTDYHNWHRLQVTTSDLDPAYPVLRRLAQIRGLDDSALAWLVVLHVTYYQLGSALTAFDAWPTPATVDYRDDLLRLPTGTERRAHRTPTKLAQHLAEWRAIRTPLPWMLEDGTDWPTLTARITGIHGNGRWAAYKTAEMLQKVCGVPTVATDAGHRYSSGPRRGLALLFDRLPTGQDDQAIQALDEVTQDLAASLGEPDIAQVETSLCDFRSLVEGRYYLGHDIDQMQEQFTHPRVSTSGDVWRARDALPASMRGEISGWTGVRKPLNRLYRDSKEMAWWA